MVVSKVRLKSGAAGTFSAYLAKPDRPNGGSVVVLQEIFGVNENIRSVANNFAEAGYYAIAPDIFWRQEPDVELNPASEEDRQRATALMNGLVVPLAIEDALVAAEYLRGLPEASGKVGAVGYCLGGKLAYLLSAQPGVDAAVAYYGVAIQGALEVVDKVQCSLLLHIAENDHLCPPGVQEEIGKAVAAYPGKIAVMHHPGVGHAFARRGGAVFDASAAARADAATFSLLEQSVAGTV